MNVIDFIPPHRGDLGAAQQQYPFYVDPALKRAWSKFSFQQRPTVLLTLTVKEPKIHPGKDRGSHVIPDVTLIRKATQLIHYVSCDLFGRSYEKHNKGLTGFGCIEKQLNHQPHLHLAITTSMPPRRLLAFQKSLFKKAGKFRLFEKSGIDLKPINGNDEDYWRVGNYVAKGGRMLLLAPNGIQ